MQNQDKELKVDNQFLNQVKQINLQDYQQQNQNKVVQKDLRSLVKNTSQYPFNMIGKVVAYKYNKQTHQYDHQYGTASIIAQNLILSAAHVLYFKKINYKQSGLADKVQFFSQNICKNQKVKNGIKIQNFFLNKNYFNVENQNKSSSDFVILKLEQNNYIKGDKFLRLNFDYQFNEKDMFLISGYGGNCKPLQNQQLFEQGKGCAVHGNFLCYKHTTFGGNSGGPVLLRKGQHQYDIVGIHKGSFSQYNYCLLLKALKNQIQIAQLLKNKKILNSNSLSEYWKQFYFQTYTYFSESNEQINQVANINKQIKTNKPNTQQNIKILKIKKDTQIQTQSQTYLKQQNLEDKNIKEQNTLLKTRLRQQQQRNIILEKRISQLTQKLYPSIKTDINKILALSSILKQQHFQVLKEWFAQISKPINKMQMRFKASQTNFNIKRYYEICGKLTNTIIIVKTQKDKIIGGYTPLSFQLKGLYQEYVADPSSTSFVFSLTQKQRFPLLNNSTAIHRQPTKSMIYFGNKLKIINYSNQQNNQFCLNCYNYNLFNKYGDDKQSYLKITGNQYKYFRTKQWEVYQLQF